MTRATRTIKTRESLLETILSQPSAPFREGHVISVITSALARGGVPHFLDPIGNIVIGAASKSDYLGLISRATDARSQEPLRVFMAHMDHPGFHGVKWKSPTELAVKWHGGSPTKHLEGAKVWLANRIGFAEDGRLSAAKLTRSGRAIDTATVLLPAGVKRHHPDAKHVYGGFSFNSHYWRKGKLIYTKSADDLVGSFAIVSFALDLWSSLGSSLGNALGRKRRPRADLPFLGLLTRAEEVGFIGAIGHFELGWLKNAKRPVICVSVETSRTLPGAEIGKGPVVRLGDKYTVFDNNALRVFSDLAKSILPNSHQRRLMDGGTCEGTAATAYGYPSIGISVPLGNYHNQSLEGGPESRGEHGPAPEFVHIEDVKRLITLCHALLKPGLPWANPWNKKLIELKRDFNTYSALMRSGP